jgi:hypothetical protein
LRHQIGRSDQMTTDDVSRIVELDLIQIKFIACEVYDHAADSDVSCHAVLGQVTTQKIRTSRYVIQRELGAIRKIAVALVVTNVA